MTNKIQELKNTLRERGFCILEVEQEAGIHYILEDGSVVSRYDSCTCGVNIADDVTGAQNIFKKVT